MYDLIRGHTVRLLLVALLSGNVSAYQRDYGPFEPGREPRAFSVAECPIVGQRGTPAPFGQDYRAPEIVYGRSRGSGPRLRAIATNGSEPPAIYVAVASDDGPVPAPRRHVGDFLGRPDSVWCADFNRDGTLDFAMPLWGQGNGLGASFYELVAALSSGVGHRIWVVAAPNHKPSRSLTAADKARIWHQQPKPIVREAAASAR